MAELAAGRGGQDDLPPAPLRQHLAAGRPGHQPRAGDVGVDDRVEPVGRHVLDQGHIVHARGDDEDIHAAVGLHRLGHDGVAMGFAVRTQGDGPDGSPGAFQFRLELLKRAGIARGDDQSGAGVCQGDAGDLAERSGRADDDGGLALDVEQGRRVDDGQGHRRGPVWGMITSMLATAVVALRTARASPAGMKQLSRRRSTWLAPSSSVTVTSPSTTT